jgi:hypothetical protein
LLALAQGLSLARFVADRLLCWCYLVAQCFYPRTSRRRQALKPLYWQSSWQTTHLFSKDVVLGFSKIPLWCRACSLLLAGSTRVKVP